MEVIKLDTESLYNQTYQTQRGTQDNCFMLDMLEIGNVSEGSCSITYLNEPHSTDYTDTNHDDFSIVSHYTSDSEIELVIKEDFFADKFTANVEEVYSSCHRVEDVSSEEVHCFESSEVQNEQKCDTKFNGFEYEVIERDSLSTNKSVEECANSVEDWNELEIHDTFESTISNEITEYKLSPLEENASIISWSEDQKLDQVMSTTASSTSEDHNHTNNKKTICSSSVSDEDAKTSTTRNSLLQIIQEESNFDGPSIMSAPRANSGYIAYSGNVSLRSESSTTSAQSFAFPVLQSEWNSSPVRMAKARPRRHGWKLGFICCHF